MNRAHAQFAKTMRSVPSEHRFCKLSMRAIRFSAKAMEYKFSLTVHLDKLNFTPVK
jgi:hypothetical protein